MKNNFGTLFSYLIRRQILSFLNNAGTMPPYYLAMKQFNPMCTLISFNSRMHTRLFLALAMNLLTVALMAQPTQRAFERAGDEAFGQRDYNAAMYYYHNALQRGTNLDVQWKYAESLRMFRAYDEAERAYLNIDQADPMRQKFPLTDLRLGEVQKSQGRYDKARQHLNRFVKEQHAPDSRLITEAQRELDACVWAQAQKASGASSKVEVRHLGKEVNSPYSDFAPVAFGDTLFFSSYRFDKKEKVETTEEKITRVMMSVNGKRSREPGQAFGLPGGDSMHVAHSAFSPDSKFMIFTYCQNKSVDDIQCDLWLVQKDIKGRWTKPVRLPEPLNQKGYTSTQPTISMDPATHYMTLWFASDRPGGQGKMDLWSIPLDTNFFCACAAPLDYRKPMRLPKLKAPQNVSVLNTPENDATPFFFQPTQTLFFSSEGWSGFGGYDVFAASKDAVGFNAPRNLGQGINTSYNDLYFFLKPDGHNGYLSSNRPGAYYLDEASKTCCNDIFAFNVLDEEILKPHVYTTPPKLEPKEAIVAVPKGEKEPAEPVKVTELPAPIPPVEAPIPTPAPEVPAPVAPVVEEAPVPALGSFVGLRLFFDNDEPDQRTLNTDTRTNYETTANGYLARRQAYRQAYTAGLSGEARTKAEAEVEAFFASEVQVGYDRLNQMCDVLLKRLKAGEKVSVILKGYTSPRAKSKYNLYLSKRRISSVFNYFEQFDGGVLKPYLHGGQLRIGEQSLGETTADASVSDNLTDQRNSVYSPAAARERRVEIVDIRPQ
jgi:outer membrane protein OmpA-like peptidoglycan-associated protein